MSAVPNLCRTQGRHGVSVFQASTLEVMRVKREINIAELQHKRYLTNREAQAYLNKSHTTLWRLVKSRQIAYSRTGLSLMFDRLDLDEYVRRNRISSIDE